MSRQLFLLSFILFFSCQNKNQKTEGETEWIDPNKIQQGSIIHDSLTRDQLQSIEYLFETFKEVDPTSHDKWIEDFKRDQNPDNEIQIWMAMADAYNNYCKNKNLGKDVKMEVYQIVLMRSSAPEEEVLSHLELKFLSQKDAREVMQGYKMEAKPISVK